ncbi:type II secretion system protein, partial [Planctomycetota bacterium]
MISMPQYNVRKTSYVIDKTMKKRGAFTLIELLVVISVSR